MTASTSFTNTSPDDKPDVSRPTERPTETETFGPRVEAELRKRSVDIDEHLSEVAEPTIPYKELLPGAKRSQAGIATNSFFLGQALGISLLLTYYALFVAASPLWRPPFFLSTLALFHFLEFYTHARYNLPNATTDTFLLFNNGLAYQLAHSSAMVETVVTTIFFPEWQSYFSSRWIQYIGLTFIIVGQVVRSVAMSTAGTNFNHRVQHKRAEGHELVTNGVYGYLRHPSYFGFFWWGVGTQMVLGNSVCFVIYAGILWRFFSKRIRGKQTSSSPVLVSKLIVLPIGEEKHLIGFFGDDYVQYRANTRVGIPFIP
jgi:protein-S-isoprenylcysteine O-methyltransferase